MTREEAIIILQESLRQNKVIQKSPNTFSRSADITNGMKNVERCIEALNIAIAALYLYAQQDNDPLTLEDLREMDGEPVWLKVRGDDGHYVMFYGFENNRACFYREISRDAEEYGKTWLAYRRKPEGGDRVDR